ncbi:MAG TPA: hypothetical protein VH062_24385 [Polyangiaceae bacterium]|jgi:hypothetical protein|nr:hypothetical protein [Polyangiaceae bacterium]
MNVTSATSISNVDAQLSVGANSANPQPAQADSAGLGAPATASISGPGRMFHQLQQLSESDPTKFKQVMSDMASSIRADAKNATGDEATRLSSIADRLDKVSQSGNLSDLAPPRPQGGGGAQGAHHGHHHGGGHHGGGAIMSDLENAFSSATSDGSSSTTSSTITSSSSSSSTSTTTSAA